MLGRNCGKALQESLPCREGKGFSLTFEIPILELRNNALREKQFQKDTLGMHPWPEDSAQDPAEAPTPPLLLELQARDVQICMHPQGTLLGLGCFKGLALDEAFHIRRGLRALAEVKQGRVSLQ